MMLTVATNVIRMTTVTTNITHSTQANKILIFYFCFIALTCFTSEARVHDPW